MKKLLMVTFCLVIFLGSYARAGQGTGNGGDVVVCKKSDGTQTFELLDLYEMREVHGLKPDFVNYPVDYIAKANHQLNKLDSWRKDTELGIHMRSYYLSKLAKFNSRIKFVNSDLEDIPDSYNTYIPRNCKLKQIAINYNNGLVIIDKRLWDKIDENNKAALVIHELLYEDLAKSGHKDSVTTRQLNAYLHGNSRKIFDTDNRIITKNIEELISKDLSVVDLKDRLLKIEQSPYAIVKSLLLTRIFSNMDGVQEQMVFSFVHAQIGKKRKSLTTELIFRELNNRYVNLDFEGLWLAVRNKVLLELKTFKGSLLKYKLQLLSKFQFEQDEFESIFNIYKFQRSKGISPRLLELFNEAFLQFNHFSVDLFDILTKDINQCVQSDYIGFECDAAKNFLYRLSKRGDVLDGAYLEATLKLLNHWTTTESEYDETLYILWHSRLRAEAVLFLNKYLKSQDYGVGSDLSAILSSFKHYKDRDELLVELEDGITHVFLRFGRVNTIVQNMYHLFRGATVKLYPFLKDGLISGIRSGIYEPNHYSGQYEILDILTLERNVDDKVIDLLGYLVRFQIDQYGSRDLFGKIKRFQYYTAYLNSAIAVELKRNLSDYYMTKDLLELLENRVLGAEQLEIVEFIAISHSLESIRELAQKIIDQQPI